MDDLLKQKDECICQLCGDMYTDPKELQCGHLFCHQCLVALVEKAGLDTECPEADCRKISLPDSREKVRQLKTDSQMVDRVRDLLRQGINAFGAKTKKAKNQRSSILLYYGAPHRSVLCDHCCQKCLTGSRFKCGLCGDFDLCADCEKLPRQVVHWSEHIFIKLKRRRDADIPGEGPHIKDGLAMGKSQCYGHSVHQAAKCSNCDVQPITGIRYKCGMCDDYHLCEKCERKSLDIHNKYHVFLVLPYECTDPPPGRQIPYEFFELEDE